MTAPFVSAPMPVRPEWADYNGHLNDACYLVIFSQATDALLDVIGMDDAFRRREQVSIFTLETHLCYLREVLGGTTVEVESRILDLDATSMLPATSRFIREMFLGGTLARVEPEMLDRIRNTYLASSQKAIQMAYMEAVKKYNSWLSIHPEQAAAAKKNA